MDRLEFDAQAPAFDRRAGLPTAAARSVATAVLSLVGHRGVVVDVGAGTGEIGVDLARSLPGRYLGFDISLPMLQSFRCKSESAPWLIRADADRPWPVVAESAGLIFLSRSAHLLAPQHLSQEICRVARQDLGAIVIGRIRRPKDSVRSQMRREMRRFLARKGIEGRDGDGARRQLLERLRSFGFLHLEHRTAASWPRDERPMDSLRAWRPKNGLGGRALSPETHHRVLDQVEAWARERWEDLETTFHSEEVYELTVIRRGV